MRSMTATEMQSVSGGGFWSGFLCGGFVILTNGAAVSPDPFTKLGIPELLITSAAACGMALT